MKQTRRVGCNAGVGSTGPGGSRCPAWSRISAAIERYRELVNPAPWFAKVLARDAEVAVAQD